jgi:hypothetical protein
MVREKSEGASKQIRDPLPEHFDSVEAAAEFWDTHDSGDYDDYFKDVNIEVDLKPHRVATDKLVNRWLEEKAS